MIQTYDSCRYTFKAAVTDQCPDSANTPYAQPPRLSRRNIRKYKKKLCWTKSHVSMNYCNSTDIFIFHKI